MENEQKNKDLYTVSLLDQYICYYKNGNLHREAGPAVFLRSEKDKYFKLDDENLYEKKLSDKTFNLDLVVLLMHFGIDNSPLYYLEGIQYDKGTWDSIIEKKKLQKELSSNLSSINPPTKKPKI